MDIYERIKNSLEQLDIPCSAEELEVYFAQHSKKTENIKAVPEYFNEQLKSAAERIKTESEGLDGDCFLFTTDLHLHENPMYSVPLIKELCRTSPLKRVFCGGDLTWAFGTKEKCLAEGLLTLELINEIKPLADFYCMRGNHDFTIKDSPTVSRGYTLPYSKTRDIIMSYQSKGICVPDGDALYFYVDDSEKKIRYIVTDSCSRAHASQDTHWGIHYGLDCEQEKWLAQEALSLEDGTGWSVVVFGHIPCIKELASYAPQLDRLADILKAFKNKRRLDRWDFTSSKAELVAYICGHNHKDMHFYDDNTLFISSGSSSALWDDRWDRSKNTVEEELFDIFLLDKTNRTLKTIRIGTGEDREFSY